MERQWVQVRRDLHQIPEIGYQEYKTQGYLESMINRLPQEHLHVEKWKTGLFVLVKGIEETYNWIPRRYRWTSH